jgi:hypothetical protein
MDVEVLRKGIESVLEHHFNNHSSGQSCDYCACDPLVDPDCRRQFEDAEVRVLAFKAWKEEGNDEE